MLNLQALGKIVRDSSLEKGRSLRRGPFGGMGAQLTGANGLASGQQIHKHGIPLCPGSGVRGVWGCGLLGQVLGGS